MILKLKGRLKLIADKVPKGNVVADIGTDHAYLPVYLIQRGICQKAIASDVVVGPVRAANKNISLYNLNNRIETRLGNGLDTIQDGEADSIIIAGMGGTLLSELLEANKQKAWKATALVLQPMNDIDIVRKWLLDNGFEIYDEEMVAEGSKIYCVLSARYDGQDREYTDFELQVGPKLITKKDPLLLDYCRMKVRQIDRVLGQLESMENNKILRNRYSILKEEYMSLIDKMNL